MALITCPECQATISDQAATCVHCGAPRRPSLTDVGLTRDAAPPAKRRRVWPWLAGAALLVVFVLAMNSGPDAEARGRARRVIDGCWKEQQRKSLDAGEQQFIAGACERLENQFREKYKVDP